MITNHFEEYVRRWNTHRYRVRRMPTRAEERLLQAGFMPATGFMDGGYYA